MPATRNPDCRIPPVRGLIPLRNRRGTAYRLIDLQRWVRLARAACNAEKADLLVSDPGPGVMADLLDYADHVGLRLSLRTDLPPPDDLSGLAGAGLFDVFLCPAPTEPGALRRWLDACRAASLGLRLQFQPPFVPGSDAGQLAAMLAQGPVTAVNVALTDPFHPSPPCADEQEARRTLEAMQALVRACAREGMEANLVGVPFCLVDGPIRAHVLNEPQFFRDHQQYNALAWELARRLYRRGPVAAGLMLSILLAQYTSFRNPADSKLFPWLAFNVWFNLRATVLRRLTRHMRALRGTPRARPESTADYYGRILAEQERERRGRVPAPCAGCALRRICDRETPALRRMLPGVAVEPQAGEVVLDPMHFCAGQPKHYDTIDRDRATLDPVTERLAAEAKRITESAPPDREIDARDYTTEGQWADHAPGAVRWFSVTNTEKESTVLARLHAPATISVTFGEGIADYIGFSFGRYRKIVCPMVEYAHRLTLHVAGDGRYVLLRDGRPVRPAEFEGLHHAPLRLGTVLEPRISLWNVDMTLVTQAVLVWEGDKTAEEMASQVRYSVLVVSTRYTRRLQATLEGIAHQRGIDYSLLEVIVAYVPGLDATGDLLDSVALAHPGLRVVRAPFQEEQARAKGFMINEAASLASGEWVMLLDSDIILPPDMFATLEKETDDHAFLAPECRKMLTPRQTALVLLGEVRPWETWQDLANAPEGKMSRGEPGAPPIGFCQIVRAPCLRETPYEELEHFAGADSRFGETMRERYGPEKRLKGVCVLHLDHRGSQWYGAHRHM